MGFLDGAIGAAIGGAASLFGGEQANAANAAMSQQQRDWEERMSSTAHTREVQDLRNAGLNPILSANSGASTPSPVPQMPVQNVLGQGVSSAMDALKLTNELRSGDAQRGLMNAQGMAANAAAVRDAASAKSLGKNVEVVDAQMKAIKARAEADEKQSKWDSKMSTFDNIGKRVQMGLGAANSAKDLLNPFKFGTSRPWEGQMKDGTKYDRGTGEIIP